MNSNISNSTPTHTTPFEDATFLASLSPYGITNQYGTFLTVLPSNQAFASTDATPSPLANYSVEHVQGNLTPRILNFDVEY